MLKTDELLAVTGVEGSNVDEVLFKVGVVCEVLDGTDVPRELELFCEELEALVDVGLLGELEGVGELLRILERVELFSKLELVDEVLEGIELVIELRLVLVIVVTIVMVELP